MARQATLPPGPPALPVLGNIPQIRTNPLGFVSALAQTYGPAATFRLGRQTVVLLSRPDAVRAVLIEQARAFSNAEFNAILRPVLGRGLLTTDGDEHRRLRRLVQPAFNRKRVESYRAAMVAHAERMLADWTPGQTLDMAGAMQQLTLSIVADVLMGMSTWDQAAALGRAFEQAAESSRHASTLFRILRRPRPAMPDDGIWRGPLARLPFTAQYRLAVARGAVDAIVEGMIAARRAAPVDTGDVASALFAARDDDGSALGDEEIRDQLLTLLGAGHATTAVALGWTFYLLARYPAVAATLRAELRAVLQGRAPSVEDLERLPYLDQVWSESLRLYPPAWAVGRLAHQDVEAAGYRLPAGTMLMLSPWVTHRLPELFAEPRCFRPERFDPAHGERHQPYAYFPFGAGPRMCIGAAFATLEGKVLLATIAQRFAPELVPGHPVIPRPLIVLRPTYGIRMTLHPADS